MKLTKKLSIGAGVALVALLAALTPKAAHAVTATLVQVVNTASNPALTQSVDAKNAFQTTFTVGFGSQPVTIPTGQRLVIDFVAIHGIVQSTSGAVQPSVIFESSLGGGPVSSYYLQPGPSPVNTSENQLYLAQPVKIYADSLAVVGAYAGFSPTFYTLEVSISGHLIPIP